MADVQPQVPPPRRFRLLEPTHFPGELDGLPARPPPISSSAQQWAKWFNNYQSLPRHPSIAYHDEGAIYLRNICGMLLFGQCIPGAEGPNADPRWTGLAICMAQLLVVPNEYREVMSMHDISSAILYEPHQHNERLESAVTLDVVKHLAAIRVSEMMADDAWAYAHQWLEDSLALQYISHDQVEPYLRRAHLRIMSIGRP